MLFYGNRKALADLYEKWRDPNMLDCTENVIAFLCVNGLLNVEKTLEFISYVQRSEEIK